MISEELLSEVLGFEIEWFGEYDTNVIEARLTGDEQLFINIYELAHKCKEWAFKQSFILSSAKDIGGKWFCDMGSLAYFSESDNYEEYTLADTEPEAIFKACEWILKNGKV